MDSSDNITSETNGAFGDGICDPDLEARLYAEIYYSNETYVQDFEATTQGETNKENCLPGASLIEDYRQGDVSCPIWTVNFGKTHYQPKDWVFDKLHGNIHKDFEHCNIRRKFPKSHRLLAHKGLWLTQKTEQDTSIVRELANGRSESAETSATKEHPVTNPEIIIKTNNCPIYHTTVDKQTDNVSCNDISRMLDKCAVSKKKRKNAKKKNTDQIPTNAFRGTKILRQSKDAVNSMGVTIEISKYRVVSKKKKLKMMEVDPVSVEISSDSDDSILEVPVPPKAQPLVIQLPDSDEECYGSSSFRVEKNSESVGCSEKELTPCYNIDTDSSQSDESSVPSPRETGLSNFDKIHDSAAINAAPTAGASGEKIFFKGNNLILDCMDYQRGASSPKEIRKIRKTGMPSHVHSDDSMMESEASNWGNIAAGQANASRNQEIRPINESTDGPYASLWGQLTLDNPTGVVHPNEDLTRLSNDASLDEPIHTLKNDTKFSITHYGEEHNKRTKRIGQKNVNTNSSNELNLPKIPEKRSKGNRDKSRMEKSLTEYFFKPMSKELQVFYNNPWGGENLDLYDIQSRMPRNPSCWAILDADLGPPSKRRGKVCPRCRTNSHFGKRCPEKASKPSCCMCGAKGHIETRCPQTMCLTCGYKYTTFRPTCGYCSKLSCNMCNGMGHTRENCPDLWRRYHDTTTETLLVPNDPRNIMKAPQYLSCCNCSKSGHDVTTCKQLRWSQHFLTPMYVSSYTDGPIYLWSRHERDQDKNSSGYIESIQVPDGGTDPLNLVSQDSLVFQCGNFNVSKSISCYKISKRLDELKNAHLAGLLAGDLKPTFLNMWQSSFVFNVRITRGPDELVLMVIQANCEELLCGIEKLLVQWLTRSDDEKRYLIYDALPYGNIDQMTVELRQKVVQLRTVLEPTELLKKITASEETLKHTSAKTRQIESTKKTLENVQRKNNAMRSIMNRRCQLVTSLYSRSWVEGADIIVDSFRDLARQLKWSPTTLSIQDYMEIVYLYNEIFTFHESDALVKALEKATSIPQPLESAIPSLPQPPHDSSTASDINPSEKIIGNPNFCAHKYYSDSVDRQFKNRPYLDKNHFNDCSSHRVSQHSQTSTVFVNAAPMSGNFAMTEWSNMITTSNETSTDIHHYIEPRTSSKSFSSDGFHSPHPHQTLLLNHYGKAKRDSRKNIDYNEGLLVDLKRKKRKLYRRSARAAIKLANSSNIPHLQKMANALKFKIIDCSIRTDDVLSLQDAISTNLSRKKGRQWSHRSQQSQTANENQTYKKCLQNL